VPSSEHRHRRHPLVSNITRKSRGHERKRSMWHGVMTAPSQLTPDAPEHHVPTADALAHTATPLRATHSDGYGVEALRWGLTARIDALTRTVLAVPASTADACPTPLTTASTGDFLGAPRDIACRAVHVDVGFVLPDVLPPVSSPRHMLLDLTAELGGVRAAMRYPTGITDRLTLAVIEQRLPATAHWVPAVAEHCHVRARLVEEIGTTYRLYQRLGRLVPAVRPRGLDTAS
jgi:hypothetical protein